MKWLGFHRFIGFLGFLGLLSFSANATLPTLSPLASFSAFPTSLPVGVETVHRDPERIVTIYLPVAPVGMASRLLSTNDRVGDLAFERQGTRPSRFVVSDGTVRTSFVGVDAGPGSPLDRRVTELLARHRLSGQKPAAVITYLRDQLRKTVLRTPPRNYIFEWDRGLPPPSEALVELFHSAKDLQAGHAPLISKVTHPVVPLERFMDERYGTCLHQALLASLILRKVGVSHRLVNGATRAVGHTWIELGDGRILDPALGKLERPRPAVATPGWIKYGDSVVFEDQVWPYLVLD